MPKWNAALVWFRRDLRDFDHAALHQALRQSRRVYCAFVFDTDILDPLRRGTSTTDRRLAYIHAALTELDAALRRLGGALIVRHERAIDAIPAMVATLNIEAVFANHDYEPEAKIRDAAVARRLEAAGCSWFTFKDQVIFETDEILTKSGQPFSVFTPFKRAWLGRLRESAAASNAFAALQPYPIEPLRHHLAAPSAALHGASVPPLGKIGFTPFDTSGLPVPPGMSGGASLIRQFRQRMPDYDKLRDFPAEDGTSRLSVHLRFGTVSIRSLARLALEASHRGDGGSGAMAWLSELIWRDFYFMILHHHPQVVDRAFKPGFDAIQWESGDQAIGLFDAWREGRTGYPLVDAAMTQLNQTGFMHNRLRMVTASFLTKDLGIDWRWGERYFAEKLNDYDLAANNGGWQWAASTGCDAQPYFRIFNPVTQSERFDADGSFIKRFLPQLRQLDHRHVHAPWLAPSSALAKAGLTLGKSYPLPIVSHEAARQRSLARYRAAR